MSNYVSPFLVLNLGSEMIFVIAQRLQAQEIQRDRSSLGTAPKFKMEPKCDLHLIAHKALAFYSFEWHHIRSNFATINRWINKTSTSIKPWRRKSYNRRRHPIIDYAFRFKQHVKIVGFDNDGF